MFYNVGTQISVDNENVTVEIYTMSSAEAEPTLVASLNGTNLTHTLIEDLGTNARVLVLVKGEGETAEITVVTPVIEEE